ncbi:NUDIX domain-containing protein [Nitrosomonas cryotolerans]|uniref:Phosphatase NudJ n=1 Tax=Nitrosomonas cryotolerans ATCC 49181 TaxID=1131553 RepID=A0A1N6HCU8_9PROT|nr:NUDIX hydrolase [Nitrosomonas cryotolerans]SFP73732.1 NUDIX domain-containing protein [Nitrosomonas cryotolerans]SIO17489.1 NUDIX domain-containing protein [Nitrosomonas cryotolerans ATCC 49181]
MIWKLNVTVAAVIEQNGRYLLVEETIQGVSKIMLNQPAGHLDPGESIIEGTVRETLEETAYTFVPQYLLGIYQWHSSCNDTTYLRFALGGDATNHDSERILDSGIIRTTWLSVAEMNESIDRHRSPLVMQCVRDHLAGKHYPLEMLTYYN